MLYNVSQFHFLSIQTEGLAIVSCKQLVADVPPGRLNYARSRRQIVVALWEPHGDHTAKFARQGILTITTNCAWTKDFPLTDKVHYNIFFTLLSTFN